MDETPLTQRLGESLLDRGDQAGRPVGDDQQREGQAPRTGTTNSVSMSEYSPG